MTIELVIDYGTGATKSFSSIPHHDDMTVEDAIRAAEDMAPGLRYAVDIGFVNRAGLGVVLVTEVDGIKAENGSAWKLSVNGEPTHWSKQVTNLKIEPRDAALPDAATVRLARVEHAED